MKRQVLCYELADRDPSELAALLDELSAAIAADSERVEPLLARCSELLDHPAVRAKLHEIARNDSKHRALAALYTIDWPRRTQR